MSKLPARLSIRGLVTALTCTITLNSAVSAGIANCNADAMLVFDASGSMAEIGQTQQSISRIAEAREAIRQAMPDITPFRQVGLIIYGPGEGRSCGNIDLRFSPSPNAAQRIIAEVEAIKPRGGTPLTAAVQEAAQVLSTSKGSGVVVLVTDGTETCGGKTCEVAEALGQTDVTVHVIGFRRPFETIAFSDHTAWFTERDKEEQTKSKAFTRCMADSTGGKFATADSIDELVAALQDVLGCPVIGSLQTDAMRHPS